MVTDTCRVCFELIESEDGLLNWRHGHGDFSCGTGDGSTAFPSDPSWPDRVQKASPDADLTPYH